MSKSNFDLHRWVHRCLTLLLLALIGTQVQAVAADGYSATARYFPDGPEYSARQANRLAAANAALTQCRDQHQQDPGYCDLIRQSDLQLHTSESLKAAVPKDRYPLYLWRVQGQQRVIYLAGSIHLLKPGFYPLPPQYEAAFAEASHLVVEVDTEKLSPNFVQQKSLQYGSLPADTSLSQVLPAELYTELGATLSHYGVSIALFERFKPSLINQQLTLLALMSVGYDPELGLESYFRARARDKAILELESFEFQLDLLLNAPLTTQVDITRDMLAQMPEFEKLTAQMVGAWLTGDDQAFAEVFARQQGESARVRAFNRALIEERNHTMTDTIVGYLNAPVGTATSTYFVLVGAAHLIGPEGIPSLLTKAGYAPRRIYSDQRIATPVTQ